VREHYDRLLHSVHFDASTRSREIFRYIVNEALSGRSESLGQTIIAKAVFHRGEDFDAILDPIVRVQMGRLRRSLERYYLLVGDIDSLRIEIPKGSYAPVFLEPPTKHTANAELMADVRRESVAQTEVAPDWPTVVIHAFDTHPAAEAESVHLKDQLAMELNRYDGVHVARGSDIARLDLKQQSSVRFELLGAVRTMPDGYLIGARLIDRATGEEVWSDEYLASSTAGRGSCSIDDAARSIAARIGAEYGVIIRLLARERRARPDMTGAFSAILRCNHFLLSRQVGELVPTMRVVERLTLCEPEVSIGWTYLARLYVLNYSCELSDVPTPIEKAISYASQGVALDPTSIRGRCVLAKALLVKGEVEAARDEIEQALRLNSESLAFRELSGWLLALAGDWDRGMGLMRDAAERNPFCLPYVKHGLWADYLRRSEFEKAYISALEYCGSIFVWREMMIASCLGLLGRSNEAEASVMELLQVKPDFAQCGRRLIGYYIKSADLRQRIVEGLGNAGLILR
jgi:tetratricopeptide (TPR) repeat protein